MRVFLINLDRRPDRLAAMADQLGRVGIDFERFSAVDAAATEPAVLDAPFLSDGPLGPMGPGDKGCTLSHMRLWRRIAAAGDSHAVILEDDIVLSPDAPKFLGNSAWIPPSAGLVKLERYGDRNQLVVLGRARAPALDRALAPLLSRHTGSGGYVISRATAARLAAFDGRVGFPIDHLLFNPGKSPFFGWLRPWQLLPAVLEQCEEVGGGSDIQRKRREPLSVLIRLRRRAARSYFDLRLVPKQAAQVLAGRATVEKVRFR